MLEAGTHINQHLQRSWNNHSAARFDWVILEYVVDERNKLEEREQFYIDSFLDLFNATLRVGRPSLDEPTRQKMREAAIERYKDPAEREKNRIKHWPEETRERLRQLFKGRTFSDETIEKMRQARKGRPWSPARRAAQDARKNNKI